MKALLTIFNPSEPASQTDVCSKFIKCLMRSGKQATAERVFAKTLAAIQRQLPYDDPVEICDRAVEYTKPVIEVRVQHRGGTTYQVPTQINAARQQALAIRWLIGATRAKSGQPMYLRLADELVAACRRGPRSKLLQWPR